MKKLYFISILIYFHADTHTQNLHIISNFYFQILHKSFKIFKLKFATRARAIVYTILYFCPFVKKL